MLNTICSYFSYLINGNGDYEQKYYYLYVQQQYLYICGRKLKTLRPGQVYGGHWRTLSAMPQIRAHGSNWPAVDGDSGDWCFSVKCLFAFNYNIFSYGVSLFVRCRKCDFLYLFTDISFLFLFSFVCSTILYIEKEGVLSDGGEDVVTLGIYLMLLWECLSWFYF